ncbi:hypothetical protein WN943_023266 [Citrus x changshan-huyou]
MTKTKGPVTWTEFFSAILKRFGPTKFDDAAEALSQLRQQTSVIAYQEEFKKLSHLVDDLPEPFLAGSFVGGLKDEIRLEVKMQRPCSLSTAIGLLGTQPNATPPLTFKRLTLSEAKDRGERGLCYYCDDKFALGHRFRTPRLFMIEASHEDDEVLDEESQKALENVASDSTMRASRSMADATRQKKDADFKAFITEKIENQDAIIFGPTKFDDAAEALSQLRQQTSVIAYQEEFKKLSHLVDDLPEPFLAGSFVGGLKDEIRLEVKMQRPCSLSTAIGLLGTQPNATPPLTFKRLTLSEAKDRGERGLCYYCDDKFALGHRFRTPRLFMIEASHEDDEVLDEESQKALENVASDSTMRASRSMADATRQKKDADFKAFITEKIENQDAIM